ncbi:hypothetical protein BDN72DRAFT_899779 [Pluteus cervinus]|uniref:Uncharacterized protein n=1 Tax=Pluteus cervinus TaxID=181527 RepID=A0ACD3AKR5_9AGAR|nr:hypothetical protein BDN72DRAFT_899779 [Pluteus cervinus]
MANSIVLRKGFEKASASHNTKMGVGKMEVDRCEEVKARMVKAILAGDVEALSSNTSESFTKNLLMRFIVSKLEGQSMLSLVLIAKANLNKHQDPAQTFRQVGRPPSRMATPGQTVRMTTQEQGVNIELQHLPAVLTALKVEICCGNRGVNALAQAEKNSIVATYRKRGIRKLGENNAGHPNQRRNAQRSHLNTEYSLGVRYYLFMVALSGLNALLKLKLPPDHIALLASFDGIMYSIFASPVVLHIREQAYQTRVHVMNAININVEAEFQRSGL